MPIQNTSEENESSSGDHPTCNRCEERATVEVTCTPIERAAGKPIDSTATFTGLCRGCLNQFRTDLDLSFGMLFERSSDTGQRRITVKRL
ncbi:hypothetical protein [Haladaptatus sp. NG-SE-30]